MMAQRRNSRWTDEEINFLEESIIKGKTLEEIGDIISLRTRRAIRSRAKVLGYGYYRNRNDKLTYFRSKRNIQSYADKQIPTKKVDTVDKEAAKSIPKTEVEVNDFDNMIAEYEKIITPYQNIIVDLEKFDENIFLLDKIIALFKDVIAPYKNTMAQLEETKNELWRH